MKVHVESDTCLRHGRCCSIAPEVFQLDEAGLLAYEPAPDDRHRAAVEDAADACPSQAITVAD